MRMQVSAGVRVAVVVAMGLLTHAEGALAQAVVGMRAVVTSNAPIYLKPEVLPVPLRTAAAGSLLEVLDEQGDWAQVQYQDPQYGRRIGWVQAQYLRVERPGLQPMDLSIRPELSPAPRDAARPASLASVSVRELPMDVGGIERSGFVIGFSLGPGFMSCEDCDWRTGFAAELHLGGMLNDRLGLMYDSVATAVDVDDVIMTVTTSTLAAQSFVGTRGWVKAGGGLSFITCDGCFIFDTSQTGFGVMGGAGVELLQTRKFAMDVQGRVTVNFFRDIRRFYTTTATLGFNWY